MKSQLVSMMFSQVDQGGFKQYTGEGDVWGLNSISKIYFQEPILNFSTCLREGPISDAELSW